jgi:hypothetical protein
MRVIMERNDYSKDYAVTVSVNEATDEAVVRVVETSLKGDNGFIACRFRNKKEPDHMPVVVLFPNEISMAEEFHRQLGECIEEAKAMGTKDAHNF